MKVLSQFFQIATLASSMLGGLQLAQAESASERVYSVTSEQLDKIEKMLQALSNSSDSNPGFIIRENSRAGGADFIPVPGCEPKSRTEVVIEGRNNSGRNQNSNGSVSVYSYDGITNSREAISSHLRKGERSYNGDTYRRKYNTTECR